MSAQLIIVIHILIIKLEIMLAYFALSLITKCVANIKLSSIFSSFITTMYR